MLVTLRTTGREPEADDWALALVSAAISSRVARQEDGRFALLVDEELVARAEAVLAAYDRENAPGAEPPAPVEWGASFAGAVTATLLVILWRITGSGEETQALRAGTADAARILHGEWWRTITALTLHADISHVAGNAAAAWLLVGAAARRLGPGVAIALVLATGALGNWLTALVHHAGHLSIGASTATFGALGVLAGLAAVQRNRPRPGRRAFLVAGATLALLGMTGVSEHADVFAHLFGLLVGSALGGLAALVHRPARWPVQALLSVMTAALVGAAWWIALQKV